MTAFDLHLKGRQAGEAGNYQQAIELLLQAHQADPNWPYPLYDLGYTYLLQGNFEKAYEYYKRCDALSPEGFYDNKTALWVLDKEQAGVFATGLFLSYVQAAFLPDNQRLKVLQQIQAQYPNFCPVYKALLSLYRSPQTRWDLINKGLEIADCDDETYGALIAHKALLLKFDQQGSRCQQLLQDYLSGPRVTAGNRALAQSILKD